MGARGDRPRPAERQRVQYLRGRERRGRGRRPPRPQGRRGRVASELPGLDARRRHLGGRRRLDDARHLSRGHVPRRVGFDDHHVPRGLPAGRRDCRGGARRENRADARVYRVRREARGRRRRDGARRAREVRRRAAALRPTAGLAAAGPRDVRPATRFTLRPRGRHHQARLPRAPRLRAARRGDGARHWVAADGRRETRIF
mmetsp:Transcript_16964/g.52867  ORF Transcript_16964/g.52867 Transcript_16964/m.52867 type:complete len:201 (+) Transcript_16964:179-781(+)